jgi:hypothetical protein
MIFEPGPGRVKVAIQGYLRGSDGQVVCGRLIDAGQVALDLGYDLSLIILAKKEDLVPLPDGEGFIREEDIIGIGRRQQ